MAEYTTVATKFCEQYELRFWRRADTPATQEIRTGIRRAVDLTGIQPTRLHIGKLQSSQDSICAKSSVQGGARHRVPEQRTCGAARKTPLSFLQTLLETFILYRKLLLVGFEVRLHFGWQICFIQIHTLFAQNFDGITRFFGHG